MPRHWQLEIQPWDPLDAKRWCRTRVVSVRRNAKPTGISVELENLESDQAGRRHSLIMPMPRPEGLTAEFFRACGMEVAAGKTLTPKEAIGTVVKVRFAPTDTDDRCQAASFASMATKEMKNGQ